MPTSLTYPNFKSENKIALVTGGSRGIGRICALALANAGAKVAVLSRDKVKLNKVVEEIEQLGSKALAIEADITDVSCIDGVVDYIIEKFGNIDILVNNAGICIKESALNVSIETWNQTLDTNLKSMFFLCQNVAKKTMCENGGKIINISSMLGVSAMSDHCTYCVSKAGVIMLTKMLALEWGKYKINVNAVAPTFTNTEMADHIFQNKMKYNTIINNIPIGRIAEPMDIASLVVFLATPASNYITGETIMIDGGWTSGKDLIINS